MPFTMRLFHRLPLRSHFACQAESLLRLSLIYTASSWLLITLLTLITGPTFAEWIAVEENDQSAGIMAVYVDPDTIQKQGNLVTMWELIDFNTMQGGRSPTRFSSTKILKQFDCAEERLRLLALTDFSGNMGTGDPAGAYIDGGHWVAIQPDSINQALWKLACNKQ